MANADLDIPEMITQLHELQRVSRETYSVQKELIDYNDNLNTTSFMSAPGYGGMPRTGPSPRVQSMASMQIAQQVSKPMSSIGGVGAAISVNTLSADKIFEKSSHAVSLRTELRTFRHLVEPILYSGGKVGIGTLRGVAHATAQAAPGLAPGIFKGLGMLGAGAIGAGIITELMRHYVDKQIHEVETYTKLSDMLTAKFRYDPQIVNKFTTSLQANPDQVMTRLTRQMFHDIPDISTPGKPRTVRRPIDETPAEKAYMDRMELVAGGWYPGRTLVSGGEMHQVLRPTKRTQTEAEELAIKFGDAIDKRRKYAVQFYKPDTITKFAAKLSNKDEKDIGAPEIAFAIDSMLGKDMATVMEKNKNGELEETVVFLNQEFERQYADRIVVEEKIKKIGELMEFEAAHNARHRMEQENIGKLAEALKQQYALEDSNWTEI